MSIYGSANLKADFDKFRMRMKNRRKIWDQIDEYEQTELIASSYNNVEKIKQPRKTYTREEYNDSCWA